MEKREKILFKKKGKPAEPPSQLGQPIFLPSHSASRESPAPSPAAAAASFFPLSLSVPWDPPVRAVSFLQRRPRSRSCRVHGHQRHETTVFNPGDLSRYLILRSPLLKPHVPLFHSPITATSNSPQAARNLSPTSTTAAAVPWLFRRAPSSPRPLDHSISFLASWRITLTFP